MLNQIVQRSAAKIHENSAKTESLNDNASFSFSPCDARDKSFQNYIVKIRENSKNEQIHQKLTGKKRDSEFSGKSQKINKVTKKFANMLRFGHLHRAQGQKIYIF